jgi:hypothetical protein
LVVARGTAMAEAILVMTAKSFGMLHFLRRLRAGVA